MWYNAVVTLYTNVFYLWTSSPVYQLCGANIGNSKLCSIYLLHTRFLTAVAYLDQRISGTPLTTLFSVRAFLLHCPPSSSYRIWAAAVETMTLFGHDNCCYYFAP
mmetsp:Transcript_43973/g.73275  ORF Transcript_43973/g.73275 Transcript_43973/m.73275 type:complete len:105 (+) Transcript_43973:105-419(+)